MTDSEPQLVPEGIHRLLLKTVKSKPIPTLEAVCKEAGCTRQSLQDILVQRSRELFEYCDKKSTIIDDELTPQIDFIYRWYRATRDLPPTSELHALSNSLNGFDAFTKRYGGEFSKKALANLGKRIQRYIDIVIHPDRILLAFPETHRLYGNRSIYNTSGEWFRIPTDSTLQPQVYVERKVIEEIIDLQSVDHRSPSLYHASGSAALPGIAKHNALLSAKKLTESDHTIMTGEYVGYINWNGYSVSGGKKGLSNIYTSKSPHTGYCTFRWFDEYPVVFGISETKLRKYLQDSNIDTDPYLENLAGEGITIGPSVPLYLVETLYANFVNLDSLKKWQQLHAPHIQVRSLEGYELTRHHKSYSPYAQPINWHALLLQKPFIFP